LRAAPLLLAASLTFVLVAFLPPAEAREVACAQLKSSTCEGFVCYDENLDGHLTRDECVIIYCVTYCCGPCSLPWD